MYKFCKFGNRNLFDVRLKKLVSISCVVRFFLLESLDFLFYAIFGFIFMLGVSLGFL